MNAVALHVHFVIVSFFFANHSHKIREKMETNLTFAIIMLIITSVSILNFV